MESLIIIPPTRHTFIRVRGDISDELAGKSGAFHSPSPLPILLALNVLNVNLIFTHYTTDSFVAAVTYSSYSLLRFHVSRGLSVSKYYIPTTRDCRNR